MNCSNARMAMYQASVRAQYLRFLMPPYVAQAFWPMEAISRLQY